MCPSSVVSNTIEPSTRLLKLSSLTSCQWTTFMYINVCRYTCKHSVSTYRLQFIHHMIMNHFSWTSKIRVWKNLNSSFTFRQSRALEFSSIWTFLILFTSWQIPGQAPYPSDKLERRMHIRTCPRWLNTFLFEPRKMPRVCWLWMVWIYSSATKQPPSWKGVLAA